MSSIAIRAAYQELAPRFEAASGHTLATEWVGMVHIRERIKAGEAPDVVIGAASLIEELTKLGKIAPGAAISLARSGVGVAVRAGAARPDLGSKDAFRRALLGARSIGISSGPSGVYLAGVFQQMGIAGDLEKKLVQTPPGTAVGELVARGEVELAFQQVSELLPIAGIDFIGPLPPELQVMTTFAGAVPPAAAEPQGGRAWLQFIASKTSLPTLEKHGMTGT